MYKFWKDPKFYTLFIEGVVSSFTFFGGQYLDPQVYEGIKVVWGSTLPIFLLIISQQIAAQVSAAKANGLKSLAYFK